MKILTDGAARRSRFPGDDLSSLRLGYAQHLYHQQGATVQRAVVVTGGWQTSQEGAYVQASRAREGTDWHVAREDLGTEGMDAERVGRLAELMRASRGQLPSLAFRAVHRSMMWVRSLALHGSPASLATPALSGMRGWAWGCEPGRDHAGRARAGGALAARAGER